MPFIGNKPAQVPLTSADIADGIITSAKIVDGTIVNADINASAAIDSTKLSGVQGKFESQLLHVRDEKASGTNGGTSQTSFTKRDLNTVVTNEISGASLASSVITLPAGTYYIHAFATSTRSNEFKLKLRNTTDSSDTIIGTSGDCATADRTNALSFVIGRFTIASSKDFELQFRVNTSAGDGLGNPCSMTTEVFSDAQIWKVA
jgi:hypothetical protein